MIELRSDPYVLKPRVAPSTESDFRIHLNIGWCRGVLFNVVALKNSVAIVEYDAILWSEDSVMFVEYKDSVAAYKSLSARRIQQMDGLAKNIARGLGYRRYCFIIVVRDLQETTSRGGVDVIPLYMLGSYEPSFESTYSELDYLDKLMAKYTREEKLEFVMELEKLKRMIETGLA
ncbi:MAG: hypothetical protein H5T42_02260 [Methanothrix sp.]|jgi:hypothetical protein|uniref:NERD domain-containing protein n=1 Tax=Methanothrix thermoacetophila (strain DSM 6194 / JCM 14653 / NBRC 101360 / PT) TaxID=349307 RepID=A0B8V6_METTP|nr:MULTISPECIES: hypothetical protein [Methanothrix]ABK15130.1 hypothetical protein Mthe_1355 [Methanothrix thermoacetophila PT]MBC7079286.1 hypothetical protein [Methanothrix sp.]NPU86750.1 hypothetical protein [Methanothrix sp.]